MEENQVVSYDINEKHIQETGDYYKNIDLIPDDE